MVNSRIPVTDLDRDKVGARTPMRCPLCGGSLTGVHVRDIGGLTAGSLWQIHAGECPEHGWFQTEFVSKPPREIFAVDRPFGTARRVVVKNHEYFSFSTAWGNETERKKLEKVDPLETRERDRKVDPLDPRYWATDPVLS